MEKIRRTSIFYFLAAILLFITSNMSDDTIYTFIGFMFLLFGISKSEKEKIEIKKQK